MNRILYLICFSILLLNSCKGTKSVTGARVKKLSAEKIISKHYNRTFNFETLSARIKIKYSDGKNSYGPSASLRIKKDETIWLSVKMLGITLAKALITPQKVSYYEKIEKTYFEGDFKVLSEWLGTDDLDYFKIQQMLVGEALFDLREDSYKSSVTERGYQLKPKSELALFERLFFIHPNSFKIASQQLNQPSEQRNLSIDYQTYQRIGNQDFPLEIRINAKQKDENTRIDIAYRSVDYNPPVSFPFRIPSGYKKITIK